MQQQIKYYPAVSGVHLALYLNTLRRLRKKPPLIPMTPPPEWDRNIIETEKLKNYFDRISQLGTS